MGQISSVDRLPEKLFLKLVKMLNTPGLSQFEIVDAINSEAKRQVISKSSLGRYVRVIKKNPNQNRGLYIATPTALAESLSKIADSLERIADSKENPL